MSVIGIIGAMEEEVVALKQSNILFHMGRYQGLYHPVKWKPYKK